MNVIPVLRLGPVLLVSVQTELNDRVATALQESVLERIKETGASSLLIDISALGLVDSFIGRVLTDTARMADVMNTDVVLVGVQPAVAVTLTEMGLEFPEIQTAINVELGLESLGYRLAKIDPEEQSINGSDDGSRLGDVANAKI